MLAFQPGRLTREYIDGRRASYVSPLALFLFSVFLLFAAVQLVPGETKIAEKEELSIRISAGEADADAVKDLPQSRARRGEIQARGQATRADRLDFFHESLRSKALPEPRHHDMTVQPIRQGHAQTSTDEPQPRIGAVASGNIDNTVTDRELGHARADNLDRSHSFQPWIPGSGSVR